MSHNQAVQKIITSTSHRLIIFLIKHRLLFQNFNLPTVLTVAGVLAICVEGLVVSEIKCTYINHQTVQNFTKVAQELIKIFVTTTRLRCISTSKYLLSVHDVNKFLREVFTQQEDSENRKQTNCSVISRILKYHHLTLLLIMLCISWQVMASRAYSKCKK